MKLKISVLSNNSQSYSNSCFVNQSTYDSLKPDEIFKRKYIYINGYPILTSVDNTLSDGHISFNKLVRSALALSRDGFVEVSRVPHILKDSSTLHSIEAFLNVEVLGNKTVEIEVEDLEAILKTAFSNFILHSSVPYILDYKGDLVVIWPKSFSRLSDLKEANNNSADSKVAKDSRKDKEERKSKNENLSLDLQKTQFGLITPKTSIILSPSDARPGAASLKLKQPSTKRRAIFSSDTTFEDLGIGGLDRELAAIIRRAFVSRTFSPGTIEKLGLSHVKGLLLHGPPGTGKTLIARQIGQMLSCKSLKVVNGPEILNKYVGASEENVRALFTEAEEDYKANGEAAELHIIIFDEIDAICKQRGSTGGGTGVNDTVVNQLLSKMDGIDSLNNILVIGMTNRKDMIDSALMRPGRFEVHIEIGLPDEEGRRSIFEIHTKKLRANGLLAEDVDLGELARRTKNYSGAEIAGVVKCAISFASFATMDIKERISGKSAGPSNARGKGRGPAGEDEGILVDMKNLVDALEEVRPALGVETSGLRASEKLGFIPYSVFFERSHNSLRETLCSLRDLKAHPRGALLSFLLEGPAGSGTSTLACRLALDCGFEFAKVISADSFVGLTEGAVVQRIKAVFEDAYKSPSSVVVLDSLERLLGYVPIGPRFLNTVLQTLMVLVKKWPPELPDKEPRRMAILGVTNKTEVVADLGLREAFDIVRYVPGLKKREEFEKVVEEHCPGTDREDLELVVKGMEGMEIGIKKFLTILELAKDAEGKLRYELFVEKKLNLNV